MHGRRVEEGEELPLHRRDVGDVAPRLARGDGFGEPHPLVALGEGAPGRPEADDYRSGGPAAPEGTPLALNRSHLTVSANERTEYRLIPSEYGV